MPLDSSQRDEHGDYQHEAEEKNEEEESKLGVVAQTRCVPLVEALCYGRDKRRNYQ